MVARLRSLDCDYGYDYGYVNAGFVPLSYSINIGVSVLFLASRAACLGEKVALFSLPF